MMHTIARIPSVRTTSREIIGYTLNVLDQEVGSLA